MIQIIANGKTLPINSPLPSNITRLSIINTGGIITPVKHFPIVKNWIYKLIDITTCNIMCYNNIFIKVEDIKRKLNETSTNKSN